MVSLLNFYVVTFFRACKVATEASAALGHGTRTTAFGHPCHDNLSQTFSLVEVLSVNIVITASIWGFIGIGRQVYGYTWMDYLCYMCLALVALYMFILSPALHGDNMSVALHITLALMVLSGLCFTPVYLNKLFTKTPLAELFPSLYAYLLQPIVNRAGDTVRMPTWPGGYALALALALIGILFVAFLWAPTHNARTSLMFTAKIGLPMCLSVLLMIFGYNEAKRDTWWPEGVYVFDLSTSSIGGHVSMYVFYGLLFGQYHLPILPLAVVTFLFGLVASVLWAQPKNRSILLFGVIHGINGALIAELTDIPFSAGPWAIDMGYYDPLFTPE
ncbi:LOW QUALITY PROTEIN: hypothetical protein KIPB_005837 [Kipferlia bialata]|uniref:Uncharacterized protein n=1 Tax=Kipferlia bialata TaxID=797122 RepID=A0A9K3CWM4_9EUKA|nr:LOW QUALITY PROTEIN: hypothetical protein KIPB_005837 [Kipferlia bialata]